MRPHLIGVVGHKRHGKGEVAKRLVQTQRYTNVKFADALKDMLRALLRSAGYFDDVIERMIEGDLKEVPVAALGDQSPRHAMITLGTDWGRQMMHPHLWIRIAQERIRKYLSCDMPVVVDDVRFLNEADAIRRMGGTLIRVVRNDEVPDLSHPSEAEVPFIHCAALLVNDGAIEDLYLKVDDLYDWEP